jgi:uncharacterized protein (TIGR04255 family)
MQTFLVSFVVGAAPCTINLDPHVSIKYDRAPITEALIDIRVDLSPGVSLPDLESIHGKIRGRYPAKQKRVLLQGQFSAGQELGAVAKQTEMGFAFSTEDGKQIFQARLDGFTFSRLRPYGTWGELRNEARRLWELYKLAVNPAGIIRVAVRYINQIDMPFREDGLLDYKDYFRTTPEISPELPQSLSGFVMQLNFPQVDFGGMLTLTQATVLSGGPNVGSVILDLDVFKETKIMTSDEAWDLLDRLRDRKNEFFEGCITQKARELFGARKEY